MRAFYPCHPFSEHDLTTCVSRKFSTSFDREKVLSLVQVERGRIFSSSSTETSKPPPVGALPLRCLRTSTHLLGKKWLFENILQRSLFYPKGKSILVRIRLCGKGCLFTYCPIHSIINLSTRCKQVPYSNCNSCPTINEDLIPYRPNLIKNGRILAIPKTDLFG